MVVAEKVEHAVDDQKLKLSPDGVAGPLGRGMHWLRDQSARAIAAPCTSAQHGHSHLSLATCLILRSLD